MKKLACALAVVMGSGLLWAGCSQNTPAVVVRSLERSGKAAFLCIVNPDADSPGQELDGCFNPAATPPTYEYAVPHVIALVTQVARGEVAIVDVTAETVVDVDRSVPGFNFLPVGATPTDIVATPGGNAAFVGIGDPTRPGIFAIPSSRLPLLPDPKTGAPRPPPKLGDWPACALPPGGVPTEMVIVPDTTASSSDPQGRRAHCDGSPDEGSSRAGWDPKRDLSLETQMYGRLKVVVTLPELGEIDVIDAQDLLQRDPGDFSPCTVEHRVFLSASGDGPPVTPTPDAGSGASEAPAPDAGGSLDGGGVDGELDAGPPGGGEVDAGAGDAGSDGSGSTDGGPMGVSCAVPPPIPAGAKPHPYALALSDDGRLFVSDDSAPVIHVVDMKNPCGAEEKAPLRPSAAVDPSRNVTTGALAVSPLTSYGKRFVYAAEAKTDAKNIASLMVFDVSSDASERTPLCRQDGRYNPAEAPDRIALPAPVQSLTFATHEVPLAKPDPVTGVIPRGVPCDPSRADDPNRPPDDFVSAGAGPRRLRGTFAFVALTNGELTVVDLDDFDTQCRRPRYTDDEALGCSDQTVPISGLPSASQEASCKVVEPHRLRSMNFFTNADKGGRHAPAMLTFPALYDKDGTALSSDPNRPETRTLPKLLGPNLDLALPQREHDAASWPLLATVLSSVAIPGAGLSSVPDVENAQLNWVGFDLHAPRAHATQVWNVTYEGVLPWFASRRGRLQCHAPDKKAIDCEVGDDASHLELFDSSVGFCNGGAQGEDMAPAGDILEITDDMPDLGDPYWSTVVGVCSRADCEEVFGTIQAPRVLDGGRPVGRDVVIEKSYQGRLSLRNTVSTKRDASGGERHVPMACCFPYPVSYTIRAGNQWIVTGQVSGFAHRLIPDPNAKTSNATDQACVVSPDPNLVLRNGRVQARLPSEPVPTYDDATPEKAGVAKTTGVFYNAQLRFVLWDMQATCESPPCAGRVRDRFFSFQEVGGFAPMRLGLSSTQGIMPQSINYVRGLQMLAIPEPVTQGLMLFDLNRLSTRISFY